MKEIKLSIVKNILKGAGSILQIAPTRRKHTGVKRFFYKPYASDIDAIRNDWQRVGSTIRMAIESQKS